MSVGRIATRVTAIGAPGESVLEVARRMETANVGCVVIVEDGVPQGIITDRDIVVRAVTKELDSAATPVSEVMTRDVRMVDEATPIEEAVNAMGTTGARRLVVTGPESKLVGVLSIDDVMELLVEEAEGIGKVLRAASPTIQASG
jgi:CBS domain-containing protein